MRYTSMHMNLSVKIRRLDSGVALPTYKTAGAVAFDIAVRNGGTLAAGERRLFPTGLVICVPKDHALMLAARSSNAKKGLQLANGIGLVDQDFCGPNDELQLALYNIGSEPYTIEKDERVAQGMFVPVIKAIFEEIEVLTAPNRGGFGTTG